MTTPQKLWRRMIALVDMNCFYAAVEQLDNATWRGKPVAVTNGVLGSTIITSSYQAREYGVKTGMSLREARLLCPALIQAPSRPDRYAELSSRIMASLQNISPEVEIYSVDEAFIELTRSQQILGTPWQIAKQIQRTVYQASGLPCSVGISGDKTTAKFAAKQYKPNGLTVIEPEQAEARLAPYLVTELSGINKGVAGFLQRYGVVYCRDMKTLPIGVLAQRYGNVGRRIWLMAQGKDPEKVIMNVKPPKTMGHGKNMPPNTKSKHTILTYLQHMSEKLAARLRLYGFQSDVFSIALKAKPQGWIMHKVGLPSPTNDGKVIFELCEQFLVQHWQGQGIWQVNVTALTLQSAQQLDLFQQHNDSPNRTKLNQTVDAINQRFGEFAIAPSRLIHRSEMPNVITPAWRPEGHRNTL